MATDLNALNAEVRRLEMVRNAAAAQLNAATAALQRAQTALAIDYAQNASPATIAASMSAVETYEQQVRDRQAVLNGAQDALDVATRTRDLYMQYQEDAIANGMSPEDAAGVAAAKVAASKTWSLVIKVAGFVAIGLILFGVVWFLRKRLKRK